MDRSCFRARETGIDFADFLIGVASNYNQADSQAYYIRHKYAGGFAQDSWRLTSTLTLNYGVRWDRMEYWSEKYNQIPTFIPGEQSVVYPTAPVGIVYPGDKGVPNTLVPSSNRFSPRLGLAYSPGWKDGALAKLIGGPGNTSIRAGYGIYYSVIEGNTMAIDEPQPPYGLSYTSPGPPLFATPFMTASNGSFSGNPFPLTFPPLNASASHPNSSIDFSGFLPIAGMTAPPPWNTYPYNENYFFSVERQFRGNTVLNLSYVGSQAHHLLLVYSANPGNPALCLALSQPGAVAPGSPTCGPFGEDTTYTTASGQTIQGTRSGLGPAFCQRRLRRQCRQLKLQLLRGHAAPLHEKHEFLDWLHLQQVDRPGVEHFGSRESLQPSRHARAFGLRSHAQFCRELSVSASLGTFLRNRKRSYERVGAFRDHPRELRFSGDAAGRTAIFR